MIVKEFEAFLEEQLAHKVTPAEQLAIFIDSHNVDHVMLLLANNGLSRVPVITKDKIYVGTISMSDIIAYQHEHELSDRQLMKRLISQKSCINLSTLLSCQLLKKTAFLSASSPASQS